jgi:hypothetical protein
MDIPEFEDLLGRLGEDLSSWPADRRDQATSLLRSSEQARAAFAEAQLLRSALQPAPVKAPAGLLDRIMQKARQSDSAPADKKQTKRDDH